MLSIIMNKQMQMKQLMKPTLIIKLLQLIEDTSYTVQSLNAHFYHTVTEQLY